MRLHSGLPLRGVFGLAIACLISADAAAQTSGSSFEHRVLATNKTSTMEKELNEAAEAGFQFQSVMGGDSAFGGKEVVVVMSRADQRSAGRFAYKLLATSKTSTMQKELSDAGAHGFDLVGMTVAQTAVGGDEIVAILRRKH